MNRILSLDGGGTWSLIQVRALIALFGGETRGHAVLGAFDLIAANSGGSIVLAALAENMTLNGLLALFMAQENRASLFPPSGHILSRLLHRVTGFGPRFSTTKKLAALQKLLPQTGPLPLHEVAARLPDRPSGRKPHLLVIAFNYDRNTARFFRSATVDGGYGHGAISMATLAEVVGASTNAPVNYFDAPAMVQAEPDRFWDGGVTGNNNPVLAGCIEAVSLGATASDLRVLSLGTGHVQLPLAAPDETIIFPLQPRPRPGLATDLAKLAESILDDPPDFATFAAHVLTSPLSEKLQPGNVVRLNPLLAPLRDGQVWRIPGGWTKERFSRLCKLDLAAVAPDDIALISAWADLWIMGQAANQPIRTAGSSLTAEIGAVRFVDAANHWRQITKDQAMDQSSQASSPRTA